MKCSLKNRKTFKNQKLRRPIQLYLVRAAKKEGIFTNIKLSFLRLQLKFRYFFLLTKVISTCMTRPHLVLHESEITDFKVALKNLMNVL